LKKLFVFRGQIHFSRGFVDNDGFLSLCSYGFTPDK